MFGKNEIVGQKYFKGYEEDELLVTSIFQTLQGEGPLRGEPALFVRLAKCNLACSFCDTYFDSGDKLTFEAIADKVEATLDTFYPNGRPDWTKHDLTAGIKKKQALVITGGEPMLQKNLGPFLALMSNVFEKTQIESNGTQETFLASIPASTILVVSPKCLEKNGVATRYLAPKASVLERADCLKFVMSADINSPYNTIPDWAHKWAKDTGKPVFCSPMNIYNSEPRKSKEMRADKQIEITLDQRSNVDEVISFWEPGLLDMSSNKENHEYTARYCIEHGFIFNMQMHLFASLA